MNIVIDNSIRTREELYEKLSLWPQYQHIYTDGSKTDTGVSLAYYHSALKTGNGYKLPKTCSIFTAEAAAILAALEYINNLNLLLLVTVCQFQREEKKRQENLELLEKYGSVAGGKKAKALEDKSFLPLMGGGSSSSYRPPKRSACGGGGCGR
ncbi:hypothetical protein NE865_12979 [Phthorimaea operculella]|nr:hypothetical protein NE865_12979 [Phthorimaea operculella]